VISQMAPRPTARPAAVSGQAHGAHGQGVVKEGQRQRALKAAQGSEEEIVAAGDGEVGSHADGQQEEQGNEMAGCNH